MSSYPGPAAAARPGDTAGTLRLLAYLALGQPTLPWHYWWAPVLGMLLWPPLFLLLDALRLGRRGD